MRRAPTLAITIACLLAAASGRPVGALETDQFYAWRHPIVDSTEVMNAKVNLELSIGLDDVNRRRSWRRIGCSRVARRITKRFRLVIFTQLELWAINTSMVDRVPMAREGEVTYREEFL